MGVGDVLLASVGGIFVLVVPGLAWTYVLFPRTDRRRLDAWERTTLAVGMSIALVAATLFFAGRYLRVPLTVLNVVLIIVALTALPWAPRLWRRRRADDTTMPERPRP